MDMLMFILFTALCAQALPELPVSVEELNEPLQAVASLSLWSQKVVLQEIGEAIKSSGLGCNIFGDKDTCVEVPISDTRFTSICDRHANWTVDCAFTYQANVAAQQTPLDRLNKAGYDGCEECSKAVQSFWCGQTLPACGTFDHVVDELLPFVASVATKKSSMLGAIKDATPRIFQSISLGLPCRSMCDSICNSCGCGHSHTFGQIMSTLLKDSDEFNVSIPASSAADIFAGIWNTPVCQLFADEDTPGFHGSCEPVRTVSKCDWCKSKARPPIFYQQMVAQLSQMFYGVMQGGLHHVLKAAAGGKGSLEENWNQNLYTNGKDREVRSSRHAGVVFLLFVFLALAVGAFVIAVKAHSHRQAPSQYIDLNSMGYTPPML